MIKTINLKIHETKRKLFKKATKTRDTNMQTVLSAFVDLYLMNPDRFSLKMEARNNMLPDQTEGTAQDISFIEKDFSKFKLKQTIEDGKKKDEYYVKLKEPLDQKKVLPYMKSVFTGCEVDLLDPDKLLGLDYDIFLIVKDDMIKDSMMDSFESLNSTLGA